MRKLFVTFVVIVGVFAGCVAMADTYTVTYSCGDGTGTPPANESVTSGTSFTPSANNTCAKTGYTFDGWNDGTTNRPAGTAYTYDYNDDITLTANWTANTYNITLAGVHGLVPSEYTELEYVGTRMAAYTILTGFTASDFDRVTTRAKLYNYDDNMGWTNKYPTLFASSTKTSSSLNVHKKIFRFNVKGNYMQAVYDDVSSANWAVSSTGKAWPLNVFKDLDVKLADDEQYIKLDGVIQASDTITNGTSNTNDISIFGNLDPSYDVTGIPNADVEYITFYSGDSVVRNLIPARRNSDDEVGFYDTVTDAFFTSVAATAFTAGPNATDSATSMSLTYTYGVGATIDDIPTKDGYTFTGWTGDNGNTPQMTVTIGTSDTGDKTYTANWTQCQACAATNATCSLSVVNNTCTYTTVCNAGYGDIQNDGAYNASCSAVSTCSTGQVEIDGTCVNGKFAIKTTNISANGTFKFSLSATGTFTVDCGTDGVLSGSGVSGNTITRSDTNSVTYTCTYSTTGTKTIRFSGTATGYADSLSLAAISFYQSSNNAAAKIASISGNLSSMFPFISNSTLTPKFIDTFSGATNLTQIPDTLFADYTQGGNYMFSGTFSGCTGLTSIPENLFRKITSGDAYMFYSTFSGCTGLTSIPENLFFQNATAVSGVSYMFNSTFSGCTGLTSIPENLFSKITIPATNMFSSTFSSCTGLTSIPENLFFPNVSTVSGPASMFSFTFSGCTGLTSIPENLFSKVKKVYANLFNGTFSGCTGLTSIPENLFSFPNATDEVSAVGVFRSTFSGCTGLTSIPANLFRRAAPSGTFATHMFNNTFSGCTGLTSIPANLFRFPNATSGVNAASTFYSTFSGCTGLTSIPSTLFSRVTMPAADMFNSTFSGCTGLTSIPGNLFFPNVTSISGASNMFSNTFSGCTGLTSIPENLFSKITTSADEMFNSTFYSCTGLTSIPGNLFFPNVTSISGAANMFNSTFYTCTGLTSIPANLFSKITTSATSMFQSTFYGCDNITRYIPPTTFAGLTNAGAPTATQLFYQTFNGTQLATSCPCGTKQFITGYEGSSTTTSQLGGRVSCEPDPDADLSLCKSCEAGTFQVMNPDTGEITCEVPPISAITLNTTGADTAAVPGTIYLKYNTGWYSDSTATNAISAMTTLPTKSGLSFAGFYTGENGTGTQVIDGNGVFLTSSAVLTFTMEPATVYADFRPVYAITYAMNDGTNYENAPTTYMYGVGATIDGVPTKTGHTFDGWCTDSELQNCAMTQTIGTDATGDKTFWAKWITNSYTCNAGYYLPMNSVTCTICPINSYCIGETYNFDANVDQGVVSCGTGLLAPAGMWESAQCGRALHVGDDVVYMRSVKKTTPSLNIDINNDGTPDFFANMTTVDTLMNSGADYKLKVFFNDQTYCVYDDTVNPGI